MPRVNRNMSASFAVIVIALLAACPAQAVERLLNPGFESGFFSFWGGSIGNNWEAGFTNSAKGASWGQFYFGGTYGSSQSLTITNTSTNAGIYQRVTNLTPGATVTFSAYEYQAQSGYKVYLYIDPNNSLAAGKLPAGGIMFPNTTNTWNHQSITATVGSGGAVCAYAWVDYDSGGSGVVCFDNLSVTLGGDLTGPEPVTDLSASTRLYDAIELGWTVPNGVGSYDIRMSPQPITSANFASATPITNHSAPSPNAPGNTQHVTVRQLARDTTYYFAMKCGDGLGNWSSLSNVLATTCGAPGTAPYWAWAQRGMLTSWYQRVLAECQEADFNTNRGTGDPANPFSWYFGGTDPDCEHQPPIGSLLQIVRDPWIVDFLGRLADHVWEISYANTNIDRTTYNSTNPHQKVSTWNESHHGGELSWNGVSMTAIDYDNPKWAQRLAEYAKHVYWWTGYTGDASTGGPHLHFRSFWEKGDQYDHSAERGPQSLVDNPENRRFTRALCYAAWRDPSLTMLNGQTIEDFMHELARAEAEDCMKTDLGKPVGVWPNEIRFDNHTIGGYSGKWYTMAGSMGGTVGTSGEWWWDWRYGWVQARDAYYELVDQYVLTGDPKYIIPVRETLRYFSVTSAINNIPPQYMWEEIYGKNGIFPWPDYQDPWGGYQYIVNYLYRQYTGDTQFDQAWLAHANTLRQIMPPEGAPRYTAMTRSTLAWDTSKAPVNITPMNPFFMAWKVTGDKEWLCRAIDEMPPGDQFQVTWAQAMYNGVPNTQLNRLPDQPITWNATSPNFAALVLDWDTTHVKWLTYNFDPTASVGIWLWSLKPGSYVLRHGPDADLDDKMDSVAESIPFTYSQRRTALNLTIPNGRMEVWEIVPVERSLAEAKSLANDATAYVNGAIVTAAFDGFFYVENPDRSCGLRVESLAKVNAGDVVSLSGFASEVSGERCLKCISAPVFSAGNPVPKPMGMPNRALGGGANGLQKAVSDSKGPALGANNIGLLVRTTGRVLDRGAGWMLIDDGSRCYAGGSARGVKVCTATAPSVGAIVTVTGISSCEIPTGATEPVRVLRALASGVQTVP